MTTLKHRAAMRYAMVAVYAGIGLVHIGAPDAFLPIMPDWVPYPRQVVIATGWFELIASCGLLRRQWQSLSGILFALYAIAVFPANIKHAVEGIVVPGLPDSWWYHGPRLAFQPIMVWWSLYATGWVDWPFRARSNDTEKSHPTSR